MVILAMFNLNAQRLKSYGKCFITQKDGIFTVVCFCTSLGFEDPLFREKLLVLFVLFFDLSKYYNA